MTLYELSLEYAQAAAALRQRISELEQAQKAAGTEQRKVQLDRRLRPLRSMYRDTRAVARHLEGYYTKCTPRRPVRTPGAGKRKRGA